MLSSTLTIKDSDGNVGVAVNADATLMAGSTVSRHDVTVYALPSCEEVVSFGGKGSGEGQLYSPRDLCFTNDSSLLVADYGNGRIQQFSCAGVYQRTIGEDTLCGSPFGVAATEDVIFASQRSNVGPCIAMFDYCTGNILRGFGEKGSAAGHLRHPSGLCLTSDGLVLVTDSDNNRLSLFTPTGDFVRCVGADDGLSWPTDICVAGTGEIVVCCSNSSEVVVFSPDGNEVLRRLSSTAIGTEDGQLAIVCSVAYAAGQVFVLEQTSPRVHVFE